MGILSSLFSSHPSPEPAPEGKGDTPGLALYQYPSCPYCARVTRAMARLGIAVELRDTRRDRSRFEELVAGGGSTQVPCLRIEGAGGEVEWMYESDDIISYLERRFALAPS